MTLLNFFKRRKLTNNIKTIVSLYGSFTDADLEWDYTPALTTGFCTLSYRIELVGGSGVTARAFSPIKYLDEVVIDEVELPFADLDMEVLEEIHDMAVAWEEKNKD